MDCVRNSHYSKCPPKMDDGRHFTDYRPNYYINSDIQYSNQLCTGYGYRHFLTRNAVALMNQNSTQAWKRNGCGPCKNLCLGIDETERPGNSSNFDKNSCIPPSDFFRYVGSDGTHPVQNPPFKRVAVPSGALLPELPRGWNCCRRGPTPSLRACRVFWSV